MSKGGTTSQNTQIPAWLESAVIENINKARDASQIGYVPYYGPDVAAFSPMQQQSMRSTGDAASAFGLAPQGFDGTAGIPQAQTFAGGIQGYSSAPLYEQSLDKLFAERPAQYRAINDMFIDPFTGSSPRSGYGATQAQTQQMTSSGDNGRSPYGNDANIAHLSRTGAFGSDGNNDGEYFGVNSEYNPYKYSMPTKDISGDGVVDYRDMSFGEAGRRDIGTGEKIGNFIKSATGIGAIESAIDYGQGLADGFTPSPFDNGLLSQTSGSSMTPEESMRMINEGADRYSRLSNDRGFTPNLSQIESGLLNGTPLASSNIVDLSAARRAEDKAASDRKAKIKAEAQAAATLKKAAAAAKKVAATKAAATKATAVKQKSTVNSNNGGPKGNNSSGGYAKSKAPNEAGSRFGL